MTGKVRSQQPTEGGGTHQEKAHEGADVASRLDGQVLPTLGGNVAVAAPELVRDDVIMKKVKMMEKQKTKSFGLQGDLVAEKTAHAWALLGIVRLQRNMKKFFMEKRAIAFLLAAESAMWENSAVGKQLRTDILIVRLKVGGQIGTLTAS